MKRRLLTAAIFLLAGAVVNVVVAWGCAVLVGIDLNTLDRSTALWNEDGYWHVLEYRELGAAWIISSRQHLSRLNYDRIERDGDPRIFCPSWTSFQQPTKEYRAQSGHKFSMVNRLADARGWPMLALWSESAMTFLDPRNETVQKRGVRGGVETLFAPWQPRFIDPWSKVLFPLPRSLPLRPIWPGFAINTVFYATLLWLLIGGAFALRRLVRVRRGLCPKCAYPMGEPGVCTECGQGLPRRARAAT